MIAPSSFTIVALALLTVVWPLAAADVAKQAALPQATYTPPDMSAYDCGSLGNAPQQRTLHIGQVVEGTYYEWNQTLVAVGDETEPSHLACISLLKPEARSLDRTAATDFLRRSSGVGAPTATAKSATGVAKQQDTSTVSPLDVPPEPRKRVRQPANGNAARPQSVSPSAPSKVAPPTPAEHRHSDDDATTPPKPVLKPQAKASAVPFATGTDSRTVVPSSATTSFPSNTVGYLVVTYPDGEMFRCTGFLVSAYVVLTAGHCIQNNNRGGWVRSVAFYPGMTQDTVGGPVSQPYGHNTDFANLKATQEWTQISGPDSFEVTQYRYDFAAIQFKTPFTFTSTFMPVVFNDVTSNMNSEGYPANLAGVTQTVYGLYAARGAEDATFLRNSDVREFALASSGGDSGSPFFVTGGTGLANYLTGSLSYGDDTDTSAGGPWYDTWNRDLLTSWMTWTPSVAASPSPAPTGPALEVTAVASLGRAGQSFLRFYNGGATSGVVTVTLADGASGQSLYTWTSPTVAGGAVLQYGMADIENLIPAVQRANTYSVSVQSSFSGYFQHILWSPGVGALTNLSTCNTNATNDPKTLVSVHSSWIALSYPSYIVAYNTGAQASDVTLGIYDGRNGSRLAGYVLSNIPPNGQITASMVQIENAAFIAPPSGLVHYIVKAESPFTGYLQHLVNNVSINVMTDMSVVCTLSAS